MGSESNVDLIINKTWEIYEATEKRRQNMFYYLFSALVVYAFILSNPEDKFELPLFSVKVNLFMAMAISPLIIAIITSSYLFLCAYVIVAQVEAIGLYKKYILDKGNSNISEFQVFQYLKRRDLTQYFNPFMFPERLSRYWEKYYTKFLYFMLNMVFNLLSIILIIIPYIAYGLLIIWLINNAEEYVDSIGRIGFWFFYSLVSILFMISPFFFYFRSSKARKTLTSWKERGYLSEEILKQDQNKPISE